MTHDPFGENPSYAPCGRKGCGVNVACSRMDCPNVSEHPYGEGSFGVRSRTSWNEEKLIRDKLVDVIPAAEVRFERSPDVVLGFTVAKLHEELSELQHAHFGDVQEFADVLEVLLRIAAVNGMTFADIEDARLKKLEAKGGFDNGVIWRKPS